MRIGSVQLKTKLLLAPIAGYCDLAFRLIVRSVPGVACLPEHRGGVHDVGDGTYGGVGLACTDLLCPHAILKENDKTLWLAATDPRDQPLCMQLYGRHVDVLCDAARWAQAHGATTIDVNMGCPVDKVTKKNGGSKLLCEPTLATDIIRALVKTVNVPVTCKIRLGWDDSQLIVDTLPRALADAGVSAITVHGRTTEMRFRGNVRLHDIARVVAAVKQHHPEVTVIGNGDVTEPQDARQMMEVTGCDGVMVGRAALKRPWLFRDTAAYLATGALPAPLPRVQRAKLVLQHFDNLLHYRGERIAVNTMSQRISSYSAGLQPWPGLRQDARRLTTAAAFRAYLLQGIEQIAMREGQEVATAAA